MEEGEKGSVCVTGATGYVASWLVKRLLQHGYSVHATVRADPGNKRDITFLTTLPDASKKLKIFTADLNQPNSFKPAMQGCIGVFHLAHPMEFRGEESEQTITNRAIQGVIGILRACIELKTIKRVVLMGSISSVISAKSNDSSNELLDENSWTDLEVVRAKTKKTQGLATYPISKTLTEKAALEFANENGLDLVVIIPTVISGPFLVPFIPNSVSISLIPLLGNPFGCPMPRNMGLVHVDDVARAQIFLFEHPFANGRYICSGAQVTGHQISQFLATKYPEFYQQKDSSPLVKQEEVKTASISSRKLVDVGFEFKYGVPEIYDDAIKCCKERDLI